MGGVLGGVGGSGVARESNAGLVVQLHAVAVPAVRLGLHGVRRDSMVVNRRGGLGGGEGGGRGGGAVFLLGGFAEHLQERVLVGVQVAILVGAY